MNDIVIFVETTPWFLSIYIIVCKNKIALFDIVILVKIVVVKKKIMFYVMIPKIMFDVIIPVETMS